jgi:hypothetical protein
MSAKNWVPQALLEFLDFCVQWTAVLENAAYVTAFGWDPKAVAACLAAIGDFQVAFDTWKAVDSSMYKALRDDAWAAAVKAMEHFAAYQVRYNEKMTPTQRYELLGVRTAKPGSPIPPPEIFPIAEVSYINAHLLALINIRPSNAEEDDPRSDYGVRIFWGVLGEPSENDKFRIAVPPKVGNDLPHSTFTRRKKYVFNFEGDSGKTVWFGLRYENPSGGKANEGPFAPLFSVVIP